jgi:N-acetylglucosamine malate deacetylase 1
MTASLVGWLLRKAAGRRLRQSLRSFVRGSSIYDLPISACDPAKSKVVVLAPHMDDEVLGCGGTIARHVKAGSDVTVVFLTDGRRGAGAFQTPDRHTPDPDGIVSVRKAEAENAARILGVRNLVFLDAEDSRLRYDTRVANRLREVLLGTRPEIVYLPFFLERHPDHRATNDVLLAAVSDGSIRFECRGYEVWTPLFPNCIVRIDETVELKQRALGCYVSQLAVHDYLHSGMGLNAYRAMALESHTGRFAEAFHALELDDYRRLHEALFR